MIQVDCVLDAKATLGESAVWCPTAQVLYWADIEAREVHRFDPATGVDEVWKVPSRPGCLAPRRSGGLVVALENGFHGLDLETGRLTFIADPEADKPGNRFNDGVTDPAGRFVGGTMPLGPREPVAAFWRLWPDHHCDLLFDGITVTNGAAFSPDGRTFYFADTAKDVRSIWACDYDPDGGAFGGRRVFFDSHGQAGRPDGGTVDAEGCYWMAGVGGWQLLRLTPAGAVDRIVEMPVERPTKPAFGGPDLDVLYVTTAAEGLSAGTEGRQPQAGGLFALRIPGVSGVPGTPFAG